MKPIFTDLESKVGPKLDQFVTNPSTKKCSQFSPILDQFRTNLQTIINPKCSQFPPIQSKKRNDDKLSITLPPISNQFPTKFEANLSPKIGQPGPPKLVIQIPTTPKKLSRRSRRIWQHSGGR